MCLIVAKPSGVNMPNNRLLVRWFKSHDDGAGLAYKLPFEDKVHIFKGFMTARELIEAKDIIQKEIKPYKLSELDMIIHFRQATEGTVKPQNCHPFPLTKDRELSSSLKCETEMSIAHNGVIYDYGTYTSYNRQWNFANKEDLTDTQQFIEDYMVDMGVDTIQHNKGSQELIITHTDSRWALLSNEGILLLGTFVKDKGGLYFSNSGYKEVKPIATPAKAQKQEYMFDYASYPELYGNTLEEETDRCDICGKVFAYDYLTDVDGMFVCDECYEFMYERKPFPSTVSQQLLTYPN